MSRDGWRTRRRRELTREERALWEKIAETVRPLAGRRLPLPPPLPEDDAPPPPIRAVAASASPAPKPVPAPTAKPARPPLSAIEPKLARTLRRGGAVDARLDLHGLRQSEAHRRLTHFLFAQQAHGARVVLVITGKGRTGTGDALFEERGVLRRLVPAWLSEADLRAVVMGFSEASPAHGGAGALYVRLRRDR